MRTQKFHFVILFFIIAFASCQKEPEIKPLPEAGYPTTYKVLSQSEWNVRNDEFQEINIHEGLDLNAYGFLTGEILLSEDDSICKDFILNKVEEIFVTYKNFIEVKDPDLIDFEERIRMPVPGMCGGSAGDINYYFSTIEEFKRWDDWSEIEDDFKIHECFIYQNLIEGKVFIGPTLYIFFNELENKIEIKGNWFPKTIIPSSEIYSINDAVPIAYRTFLEHTGLDLWESKHEFNIQKLFIQVHDESSIEVRECWQINADVDEYFFYYVFIDTQTGEVLKHYRKYKYYY